MTAISTLFEKPVDRTIEGVIKADDDQNLLLELQEYVLTEEIAGHLEVFFENYARYTNANGVWISGFFGSGKSHLLKMLALVMEDRQIDGQSPYAIFYDKCKQAKNGLMLTGHLEKAKQVPSKSILFNIDNKATNISKKETDAVLSVFLRVFNEFCGYYGNQPHIAKFERTLDQRKKFQAFKSAYEAIAKKPWERGREEALFENRNIAAALAEVNQVEPSEYMGILKDYESQYRLSIEDFSQLVLDYLNTQDKGFRLNFFVDEVGQYIADNVKLMTNLQTIAESLNTVCKGRAWIIVTAQEDMHQVVGTLNQRAGNDFSKIQDRFKYRLKLTSQDVDEVIQKRLLSKMESAKLPLRELHFKHSNNFRTLFAFQNEGKHDRVFEGVEEFIDFYPFLPYQFSLFQAVIKGLSDHNAFEGRHSSVGERSMLGVFRNVALQIIHKDLGALASFDLMYEGIRTALKTDFTQAVNLGEKNLRGNTLAIRLLKTIALLKYVKDFAITAQNLKTLLLDSFDTHLPKLAESVKEALDILEKKTYIERKGESYEYLTNLEKDVEEEINQVKVDDQELHDTLKSLLQATLIKDSKIRHAENRQDYAYAKFLDEKLIGRDEELKLHFVSPLVAHEHGREGLLYRRQAYHELLVLMPLGEKSARFVSDLERYKKTERYVNQTTHSALDEVKSQILRDKRTGNDRRYKELEYALLGLVEEADFYIKGTLVEKTNERPEERIKSGLQLLLVKAYTNLKMLGNETYREEDILSLLDERQVELSEGNEYRPTEAEQEIINHIRNRKNRGQNTSADDLLTEFEPIPYGWYPAAVLSLIARLLRRNVLNASLDGQNPSNRDLATALRNKQSRTRLILENQAHYSRIQKQKLKEFHEELTNGTFGNLGPKEQVNALRKSIQDLLLEVEKKMQPSATYPFLLQLEAFREKLLSASRRSMNEYYTAFSAEQDEILALKEELWDPILAFMNGEQRHIYDEAVGFLRTQDANISSIDFQEVEEIKALLDDPKCFFDGRMQRLKTALALLQEKIKQALHEARQEELEKVRALEERLLETKEFQSLGEDSQQKIRAYYESFYKDLGLSLFIDQVRALSSKFQTEGYALIVSKIGAYLAEEKKAREVEALKDGEAEVAMAEFQEEAGPERGQLHARGIAFSWPSVYLESEADIDAYLAAQKEVILEKIKEGYVILA